MTTPRGIRNHNPGNVEHNPAVKWQGLDSPADDGRFCRFQSPKWGIRAICRILIAYQDKHGINTVRGVINRWAPPSENDTGAYARHVASKVDVVPDQRINVHEARYMRPLVEAIILHENGVQPYTAAQIEAGMVLAGVEPEQKPLAQSRTVKGGQVAAGGLSIATVTGAIAQVKPAVPVLKDVAGWAQENASLALIVVGVVGLAAVGYMLYARYDDRRKGLR